MHLNGGSGFTGGGTPVIKSIQRGVITIAAGSASNTGAITAVDPNYAVVRFLGQSGVYTVNATSTDRADWAFCQIVLTTGILLTATRGNNGAADPLTVAYEVIEYTPAALRSPVQRGSITIASGSNTNTAAITAVDTAKSMLEYGSNLSSNSGVFAGAIHFLSNNFARLFLTSGILITATRGNNSGFDLTVPYQVVEFN